VIEKFLSLPGDVQLTIHPASTSASYLTASLANLHGDTLATVNADNAVTGTFNYDPFGNLVSTTAPALLNGGNPNNTVNGGTFGMKGQSQKETEVNFTLQPTQMGARVYIASLGRFLQTDPVPGGTPNSYVYPTDPVNKEDTNGKWGWYRRPIFISHVSWSGKTLRIYPSQLGRTTAVSPWSGYYGYMAWLEVLRMAPGANRANMKDQFFCHWDIVSWWDFNKSSWNLDSWRPNVGYWKTVRYRCNPL
jgi:RHS repeat-associated protein